MVVMPAPNVDLASLYIEIKDLRSKGVIKYNTLLDDIKYCPCSDRIIVNEKSYYRSIKDDLHLIKTLIDKIDAYECARCNCKILEQHLPNNIVRSIYKYVI